MPATPIPKSTRFYTVGRTQCYFLPTIVAGTLIPTRTEMDAGTDLTREIAEMDGWSTESEKIETPDMVSRFVSSIPGAITAEDSSISFYASEDSDDARTVFPRDTAGFIIWLDSGDVADATMDIYPVQVASAPKVRSMDEATLIRVDFNITQEPVENVVVPAPAGP
jgi:hypothetical protein